MNVATADIDTDRQPPMGIPLCHFVVGLAFLVLGGLVGFGRAIGVVPGIAPAASAHLLVAGWVGLTIMGAMTQFVPVWSGVPLHSRRLARLQLPLAAIGLLGLVLALLTLRLGLAVAFAALAIAGFWLFSYNVARTLVRVERLEATLASFGLAIGCFLAATLLGGLLVVDYTVALFGSGVDRVAVIDAHVTLAVLGGVMLTVFGAIRQLITMFTGSEFDRVGRALLRVATVAYPIGLSSLVVGHLSSGRGFALVGGTVLVVATLGYTVALARPLARTTLPWTPLHAHYAVAIPAIGGWALYAASGWLADPLAPGRALGPPAAFELLAIGGVGFVVLGTLYHVIPFVVWFHAYSDRLGLEAVPTIDDCYSDRLASLEFLLVATGAVVVVLGASGTGSPIDPAIGWALLTAGFVCVAANMALVIARHAPGSIPELFLSGGGDRGDVSSRGG